MSTFNDTVKQMWDTRPPRIPKDQGGRAYIGGVCEGIGVRYQIDPTIVRIAFIVTTFAVGGGIAAYLLAWMCMPRYGETTYPLDAAIRSGEPASEQARSERTTGWVLLIFFILMSGFLFFSLTDLFGSTAFIAIALLLAAWYGLHHRQPKPPAGLVQDLTDPDKVDNPVNLSAYTSTNPMPTPPAWDPLGTAPFAWDLPEPPPREEPQKKKPRIWAWIIGGFVTVLVIGGLLIAIGAAIFIGANNWSARTYEAPETTADLADTYTSEDNGLFLDLTLLPTLSEERDVTATAADGNVEVQLPETIPVNLSCETGANSNCASGAYNEDASGETLNLTLHDSGDSRILVHHSDQDHYSDDVNFMRPTSEDQLQNNYGSEVGPVTIDFRELPPLESARTVSIDHGIGPLTVLPPSSPYALRCDDGLGSSDCVDGTYNQDADGELLTIEIDGGIGPVHMVGVN